MSLAFNSMNEIRIRNAEIEKTNFERFYWKRSEKQPNWFLANDMNDILGINCIFFFLTKYFTFLT